MVDLSNAAGLAPAAISRYESGKIDSAPVGKIETIAKSLGCTVQDLVSDDMNYSYLHEPEKGKSSSVSREDEDLLKGYHSLTPELQDIVRRLCQIGI